MRAPKYAFNGPYAVHVFLGDFSTNPEERAFDKNLVGSWHVFANDVENTGCINCLKSAEENLVVTGSVPLTSALLERIEAVGSLDKEDVERYLKKELHWRINKVFPLLPLFEREAHTLTVVGRRTQPISGEVLQTGCWLP